MGGVFSESFFMKTGLIFDALDLELNRGKDLLKNGTKKSLIEKL